ncbi:MAG: ABC transporter ATP-binding protein [Candidatus Hodarchaeales archaeon]|jgi:ABC-type multidrug transport system ATPase subunit
MNHDTNHKVIVCNNLTRTFGEVTAVNDLSFSVNYGTIFGLMGPNGAGKTTTLRIISGIIPATSGECKVAGLDIYKYRNQIKKITGLLPESAGIYQTLTAREFLLFIASLYRVHSEEATEKLDYYFDLLDFPDEGVVLSDLSRGQRQKTMFIASIINNPEVLLLDEPIATLDPFVAHRLKKHIETLARERVILISSHSPSLIEELCSEVLFMSKGSSLAIDTPTNLKKRYQAHSLEESYLNAMGSH